MVRALRRAVVAGALASKPGNGGEAWVRLTWALGLRRLGFDVLLAEQAADPSPAACEWFSSVTERFGLAGAACLVHGDGARTTGLPLDALVAHADGALLVNLSGHLALPAVLQRAALRLFVDLDPGYTQLWAAAGDAGARLDGHDAFATVGANLGDPAAGCTLPTADHRWIALRPPVLLEAWPATPVPPPGEARFTTVASWRNPLGTIEHGGRVHGSKAHAFRRLGELPRAVCAPCELALAIHDGDAADAALLRERGWRLTEPAAVAGTPEAFRTYVRGSLAELSAAQPLYVEARSGWFSDRSAHYLASGRPVLVEDTGLDAGPLALPVGEGLLTFRDADEAAAGAAAILADPLAHGLVARALAERCFDSDVVLGGLLAELGTAA